MPTNRNSRRASSLLFALALIMWLVSGCGPAGPRALLKGERLIHDGRYSEAVESLRTATELMPRDAAAWNLLGLAYHGNRQPEEALRAYRTALTLDHKLSAVRYNLGCLLLEQNQLGPAIEELSAFTITNPSSPDGWLKLGSARLRARHLDESERCFNQALEQQPKSAEALNGLGLVAQQRRRTQDAALLFQKALAQDPAYAPALLNLAVLNHQSLNNKAKALQLYRQYLARLPRPADADAVEKVVRSLEPAAAPAAPPTQVAVSAPPVPRTNEPPPARAVETKPTTTSTVATTLVATVTPPPKKSTEPAPEPTNALIASLRPVVRTNIPTTPPVTRTKPPVTTPPVKPTLPPTTMNTVVATMAPPVKPVVSTSAPPTLTTPLTNPLPELQVTQVAGDVVIRPAQDLAHEPAPTVAPTPPEQPRVIPPGASSTNKAATTGTGAPAKEKKGFFAKLNPFKSKPKTAKPPAATTSGPATGAVYYAREPEPSRPEPTPLKKFSRYSFLSPAKPGAGNRVNAERSLQRGYAAHQAGKYALAISEYQEAVKADPGCFEAYYNIGLAAQENRDFKRALQAYEYALSVQPDSADARYNFALALKQSEYPIDAADQLNILLKQTPDTVRAHLLIGNIYAQLLNQPSFAREHYVRVLELEPRHPEAARIRFWLAANP